ncbi:hypothetical protein [Kaistella antarctica]|uniref:Uncharacterized protein n=1 Tax=Kaistella antarctica TaxID=266748 RepID=A0A448NQ48_9FLAO|nr:hypothetical protein [Kaistella antarctica]KEY19237.1 hypothetical protein HY04_12525 [Kaistella antarctica]SEW04430.1 hypothetical protein SAMN05421765_1946 [Kaistella antarctica]VEH98642.1 Uncharacterised protein [Kaistella antarctica]
MKKYPTMIDKNFYLENLSAFDILIQDEDRKQAEEVIFRVYSILQRDKIWLRDIATEEEIFEEDAELLEEVEEELKELDEKYNFRFDDFYKLVQQEMKKIQSTSNLNNSEEDEFDSGDETFEEKDEDEFDEINEDFEIQDEKDLEEDEDDEENTDTLSHLSDEEIDLVPEYILASAKTRFNYPEFLKSFPIADEELVEEQFLFPIIVGKAFGETDIEIAGKIHSNFVMSGYQIEMNDLITTIEQKGKELGLEILVFKVASDSLHQGAHPTAVVEQISQLLKG